MLSIYSFPYSPMRRYGFSFAAFFTFLLAFAGCSKRNEPPPVVPTSKLATASAGASAPSTAPASPASHINVGPALCLTTQWLPVAPHGSDIVENRLLRELVRQAILIAARDELGLVTRDETIEEPFPKAVVDPLSLKFEVKPDGSWDARLFGAGAALNDPIWQHQAKFEFWRKTIYAQFAEQVTAEVPKIAGNLKEAGASGAPPKLNPGNVPPSSVRDQLRNMNFVSQFEAVRAAHRAIAEKGPSLPWLGVLVRGYANLALLTEHTWSSHYDAFAARSLLYSERMITLDNNSRIARWHRAYARAIIGAHGSAMDQLADLEKPPSGAEAGSGVDVSVAPPWTTFLEPYVKFEHEKLAKVAAEHPELRETVAFLRWHQYRSYMHGPWIYEKGLEAMKGCPEAYGVYSILANWNALTIQRTAASQAPAVFSERLPARIAELKDLPSLMPAPEKVGAKADSGLSPEPMKIARMLKAATEQEATPTECSWSILAGLITEEQFIEAANFVKVSSGGTEYSKDALLKELAPLVEGHRYAAYIQAWCMPYNEAKQIAALFQKVTVVDPRACMDLMLNWFWHEPSANGKTGNDLAWSAVWSTDFTHPSLLDSWYNKAANWTDAMRPEDRQMFARDIRDVSPASPNALRLQWETSPKSDPEQLKKWEAEIKGDPFAWISMASAYYRLGTLDDAARCYQKSLGINPSFTATEGLANCYYYQGKKEEWRATLEAYLKQEDLSLAHARIHEMLAGEFIANRNWKEAEPHALAAAESYSANGLWLASRVYEGMRDWAKSEKFAAEATRGYPTYAAGTSWYYWCRRTGRGDLQAAKPFAERSIALASTRDDNYEAQRTFVYRILEGDNAGALAGLDQQVAVIAAHYPDPPWHRVWRLLHIVALTGETKDATRKKQSIDELRTLVEQEIKKTDPDWVDVVEGLCRAFEGNAPDSEFLKKYDRSISNDPANRCDYSYLMGTALAQLGQEERAKLFWQRSAFGGPFECLAASLAGYQLVKKYGPERGGLPAEFAAQEAKWNAAKPAAKGSAHAEPKSGTSPSIR